MIYCCESCRFVFERVGDVTACPKCGMETVREAKSAEKDDYIRNKALRESSLKEYEL